MTLRQRAIERLTFRYNAQCDAFPITREIPLQLYIARNLACCIRNLIAMDSGLAPWMKP
jgi:hypothetical protein